ncbi:aminoacyl--tRNA ligase-related protein [Micromonospora sp. HM5-17]|uniref:aminoacyl--tRNA ligase-related protein n=1 Tax=Micromonospora sp. HM5-17 TaxID=2487710 RepID=UPI0013158B47|nr:aminoacyl--tRNA ligase-related protein [Micromonospora sp. HM5-17]
MSTAETRTDGVTTDDTSAEGPGVPCRLAQIGLRWHATHGQASLFGPLWKLAEECDQAFRRLADVWHAEDESHPAFLSAECIARLDYLRSFPHQATFPVTLDSSEANVEDFLNGPVVDDAGHVAPTRLAPISAVLTPAACYHLYQHHEGERLTRPRYLTTRNTCFRHEESYRPLRRQWSFTMREVVCIGTRAEVGEFLDRARWVVNRFTRLVDLPIAWQQATDPFFQPMRNPKYLMQLVQPVKHEATYGAGLAIASVNLHHDHFGERFDLSRDGKPAYSGCLAFGLERWLFAITDQHGSDPADWPDLVAASRTVVAEASVVRPTVAASGAGRSE